MNKEETSEAKAQALFKMEYSQKKRFQDANRFHTKNLFGLWLVVILSVSGVLLVIVFREGVTLLAPVVLLMLMLILATGAYSFQEVRRLHKKIDAVRKLNEEKHRTNG